MDNQLTKQTIVVPTWSRQDWLALLLIVAGYLLIVWLMPIQHSFAVADDWSYYQATARLLNGQGFSPPDWSCATLVSNVYWGALFASVFGLSFTTLTLATMVLSLIGALSFYAILRRLGFSLLLSGLGTALLVFNPTYLSLSYSYMTDVSFTAMLLLSCLLYMEGMSGGREGWLWLGSLFAALAFLDRQFGLLLPLAAILWLLYSRRLNWRNLLAIALVPALVGLVYMTWRNGFGTTYGDSYCSQGGVLGFIQNPGSAIISRGTDLLFKLPMLGLTVPLISRVKHWWLIPIWAAPIAAICYYYIYTLGLLSDNNNSLEDQISAGPFNLAATPLWWLGVVLAAWLLAGLSERGWRWATHIRPQDATIIDFLYLFALLLSLATFVVNQILYFRYLLPITPFIIIAALVPLRSWQGGKLIVTSAVVALLACYSVAAHLDDFEYQAIRWQAGAYLLGQGVAADRIDNAMSWDGFYLYDEAKQKVDTTSVGTDFPPYQIIDHQYIIVIHPQPGYHTVKEFAYFNRLDGFRSHNLLVQQRDNAKP